MSLQEAEQLLKEMRNILPSFNTYRQINEYICLGKKILPFFEKHEKWKLWVECLEALMANLCAINKFDESLYLSKYYMKDINRVLGKEHFYTTKIYHQIAFSFRGKTQYNEAIKWHMKAIDVKRKKNINNESTAKSYLSIGLCYYYRQDYQQSINFTYKALKMWLPKYKISYYIIACYMNLGTSFANQHNYESAINFYQKGLKICLKSKEDMQYKIAEFYNNLGICFSYIKKYKKSIYYHQKALGIKVGLFGENHHEIASSYSNIAIYYNQKEEFTEAINYGTKALNLKIKILGNHHILTLNSLSNLGFYLEKQKNYLQAIKNYKLALQSDKKQNRYRLEHYSTYFVGRHPQFTFSGLSRSFFALQTPKNIQFALFTTQVNTLLIQHIRQSFANDGSKLTLAESAFSAFDEGIAIALHAHQLARTEPQAWRAATQNIANINQDTYPADTFAYCWTAQDCLHTAFHFCEQSRAMVLYGNIKEKEARGQSPIPKEQLETLQDIDGELNYLQKQIQIREAKPPAERDEQHLLDLQVRYGEQKEQREALINSFERDYPTYYKQKYDTRVVSVAQVQAQLNAQTALIEYFVGEKNIYIFGITQKHYIVKQVDKPDNFDEMLRRFDHSINRTFNINDYKLFGHQLYQLLLSPILEADGFADSTIEHLKIIPDGPLSYLPFEALFYQDASRLLTYNELPYLLDRFDVDYHFSATLWLWDRQRQAEKPDLPNSFLGFAPVYKPIEQETDYNLEQDIYTTQNVDYQIEGDVRSIKIGDKTYKTLVYSEEELKGIATAFKQNRYHTEIFLHENATVANFKKRVKHYKFIHIAGHHIYNRKYPHLSGIILSPKIAQNNNRNISPNFADEPFADAQARSDQRNQGALFYINDAHNLDLQADLVVLSCCDTGKGDMAKGEGTIAINRGFLFSGASHVLYTLFKVPDKQSSALMRSFFTRILQKNQSQQKLSYRKALCLAKRQLVRANENVRPKHWAGYVLMGSE